MSQIRKPLFTSAILGEWLSAPQMPTGSYSHTGKQTDTALYSESPGVLSCRVLHRNMRRCPGWEQGPGGALPAFCCTPTHDSRVQDPLTPNPDLFPRPHTEAGAGFAVVQPPGTNVRHGDPRPCCIQSTAQTSEGSFKGGDGQRGLATLPQDLTSSLLSPCTVCPENQPLSCQKQVLRWTAQDPGAP